MNKRLTNGERALDEKLISSLVLEVISSPLVQQALAAYAHEAWAGWTQWMMEKWDDVHQPDGEPFQARWRRQMTTPYHKLSATEQRSDLEQAQAITQAIASALALTVACNSKSEDEL